MHHIFEVRHPFMGISVSSLSQLFDTSVATNIGMDVSLWYTDLESFGCIPSHGIAGSLITPFAFLKALHTDFYSDGICVDSHQ